MTLMARSTIPIRMGQAVPDVGTLVVGSDTAGVGEADGTDESAGDGEADGTDVTVGAGVAVGAAAAHVARVMVSSISVTAPLRASARPSSVTPSAIVIDVRARMLPAKVESDPSVAELVTCQKTLHG